MRRSAVLLVLALIAYDSTLRRWMLNWGSIPAERKAVLPGDEVVEEVMTHRTRAVTIKAPPQLVWPWLVQLGDSRAGWYSYDWIENCVFPGMIHRADGRHSSIHIHPELQDLHVGDRIDTAGVGALRIGAPVTTCEPNRALVIGSWAFILQPLPGERTRLLNRERESGWLRQVAPRRSGVLRGVGAAVDYVVGEPLHFAMVRKMMLGIKQRAEAARLIAPYKFF